MEIKIQKKHNKDNKEYIALIVDMGYRYKVLSFFPQDIAEMLGCSVKDLYDSLASTNEIIVGEINL